MERACSIWDGHARRSPRSVARARPRTRSKTTREPGWSGDAAEFEQAVQAAAEKAGTTITIVSSKPGTGVGHVPREAPAVKLLQLPPLHDIHDRIGPDGKPLHLSNEEMDEWIACLDNWGSERGAQLDEERDG